MRRLLLASVLSLGLVSAAAAAGGRVYKVLPQFLDAKGRESLTPSLYDRDAYQAFLRKNASNISAIRFSVQWKVPSSKSDRLKLRVELRGVPEGDAPKQATLESPVRQKGWFSHWAKLSLAGQDYKEFGPMTAWRVTLWDGEQLLDQQRSFLWSD